MIVFPLLLIVRMAFDRDRGEVEKPVVFGGELFVPFKIWGLTGFEQTNLFAPAEPPPDGGPVRPESPPDEATRSASSTPIALI